MSAAVARGDQLRRALADLPLLIEATGKEPEPSAEVRPLRNVRGTDPAGG